MAKTGLCIKILGEPCLRKRAKKVETVTDRHRKLLDEMAKMLSGARGIGLAGPQVGVNECLIVVDIGNGLHKLVNPRVTAKEGEQVMEEGCLSVPGVYIKVKRAARVTVEGLDENGKPVTIEAKELLAVVLQHEIDHLNGKLICDYVSVRERMEIELRMNELRESKKKETSHA